MSKIDYYDNALLGILQNEGQITNFLDIIFSFLFRKTDFFRHMLHPKDNYGFMPGISKKLVLSAFRKYEAVAAVRNEKLKKEYQEKLKKEAEVVEQPVNETTATSAISVNDSFSKNSTYTLTPTSSSISPTITTTSKSITDNTSASETPSSLTSIQQPKTTDTTTTEAAVAHVTQQPTTSFVQHTQLQPPQATCQVSSATATLATSTIATTKPLPFLSTSTINITTTSAIETSSSSSSTPSLSSSSSSTPSSSSSSSSTPSSKPYNPDDDPELEKLQKDFQARAESYNGAMRVSYSWSQSITDLDVYVKVPSHVRKGKQVKVVVEKQHVMVSHEGKEGGGGKEVVVVDDGLCWPIHTDQVTWSLEPGLLVHISMEKIQERWWDALLLAEPKISIRKIDNSRPITDLDNESQAKVAEMMHNERQKRLGLPQSHELKMHQLLKHAWDVEGSPFKGQPFDPSKVNFSQGPMQ